MSKPLSVQKKMSGIIFLVSMFVMLVTSLQFVFFELKRIQDFAREDLKSLAKVISSNSGMPMALKDHAAMREILNSLGARTDVASAYLLSVSGQSIVSYATPQISSRLKSEEKVRFLQLESEQIEKGLSSRAETVWEENGRMTHFMPVVYENRVVGYSYISFETSALAKQKILLAIGWLLAMGAAVIVTFLLSSRLQKHITSPIEELASRMKQISLEKRLVDPDVHESKDEFGQLFEGFDEMIKALKERDQLLEKHRQELELEVQVRTRALEAEKEKAEQATLAKSKFLANMSHEVRTPMIGVLGMADLLRRRELDSKDTQLVETIYRSGEALLTILNDILDFSKIEAGRLEFETVPVDLKQLLQDVVQLMMVNAHSKNLELISHVTEQVPVVVGDPGRIRQVLLNLVGNAVKFTESGTVSVSLVVTADEVVKSCNCIFVVQDTGPGISEDDHESIFDSFSQGSLDAKRVHGGTGLGLSIVRELVQIMGGSIKLETEIGIGSTFTISLPLPLAEEVLQETALETCDPEPDAARQIVTDSAILPDRRDLRILLAEDNPTTQNLISILIGQLGFDLTIVSNGAAAVKLLEKETVDLILMDCQMPEMDGYAATALLRSRGVETPIVALTAYARAEDEAECLSAGMNDFLTKPFRQAEMQAMLDKWLPLSRAPELCSAGTSAV